MPTVHTITVRVTSHIDLANALMYFVTDTPVMLNVAIEKIPNMQNKSNGILENACLKYADGSSKNANPSYPTTHADAPKLQGTKLIMAITTA